MRQWFRNVLKTLLAEVVRHEIAAARHAESSHIRELTAEVEDVTEKLNRQLARMAMRRLRETRAAEEAQDVEAAPQQERVAGAIAGAGFATEKERVRALWAQRKREAEAARRHG